MTKTRIAIATCADYPELKGDDELLCEALRQRGFEAESVVWDADRTDWGIYDLCLVRSTWDYHDKHAEFIAWTQRVEAVSSLPNPAALIALNSDKRYLRELTEAGVATVPTLWVERGSDLDLAAELASRGWDEVVVKPVVDLGAKNLHRARAGEAQEALAAVLERGEAMVQPFLPSLEAEGRAVADLHRWQLQPRGPQAPRRRRLPGAVDLGRDGGRRGGGSGAGRSGRASPRPARRAASLRPRRPGQ
jgi:hypothetical protein